MRLQEDTGERVHGQRSHIPQMQRKAKGGEYDMRSARTLRRWILIACLLVMAFYYSISLAFGAAFNRYFLLYTVLFSVCGYAFGCSVHLLSQPSWKPTHPSGNKNLLTALFLFLAGATALIWLGMILLGIITGDFSEFTDVNTTEPTFALGIGIVFLLFVICARALLKQKECVYRFTPVLLTFYSLVAVQTIVQF